MRSFSLERIETATGPVLVVSDDDDLLRAVEWQDHEDRMHRLLRKHYGPVRLREVPAGSRFVHALQAYFQGDLQALRDLPTQTNGTPFQQRVWAALRSVPVGSSLSYGRLAAQLGRPTGARAVGLANGANPIAIVVPCHRIVGADASLTGYSGGVARKRWLLAHEGAQPILPEVCA